MNEIVTIVIPHAPRKKHSPLGITSYSDPKAWAKARVSTAKSHLDHAELAAAKGEHSKADALRKTADQHMDDARKLLETGSK